MLHVAETGSTNADLLALAAPGGPAQGADRLVLVADHQTAGRGRLDRTWEARPGANLLVSILFRHQGESPLHRITQAVALAAADACRAATGAEVELKWPNDLLLGDRKLAGILAQTGVVAGRVDHVVGRARVEHRMGAPTARPASTTRSLRAAPESSDGTLLRGILEAHDGRGSESVAADYRDRLGTIGRSVRIDLPSGEGAGGPCHRRGGRRAAGRPRRVCDHPSPRRR